MIHAIAGLATLTVAQAVALAHGFGTLARPLGGYNQAFTYSFKMTRLMLLALVLETMVAEIQGQACGGHFTGINGVIASPGHPGFYPNDQNCMWKIDVPPPGRIRLQFGTLRMENSPTCEYDFLKITTPGTPPSKYCGVVAPNDVITPGNTVTINFISDHSIDDKGFSISYSVVTDGRDLQDILDRIDRLESTNKGLEDHITQLNDTVTELTTNNANLSSQLAAVNNTVTECKEELTNADSALTQRLSACSRSIAFDAYLRGNSVDVPHGHTVVYPHVRLNQGGDYDDVTGVFTCSVPGTYMFHVHAYTGADTSHYAILHLHHNDALVARLLAGWRQDNYDSSSLSAVLDLQSGDKVKVTSSGTSRLDGYTYANTFTGALLHAAAC